MNWGNRHIVITIVGCGGTGAQVATGMPYLHQALLAAGHPYGLRVFLVDGDRISGNELRAAAFQPLGNGAVQGRGPD